MALSQAIECIPAIVNDGMVFPFANLLDYSEFSLIYSKRDVPNLPALLRNVSTAEQVRRPILSILFYSI